MDTSSDYLIALQLQEEEFIDLTETTESTNLNIVDPTKSNSDANGIIVNLTNDVNGDQNSKRKASNTIQQTKRPCHQDLDTKSSLVDHTLEFIDPNPDIYVLFMAFNRQYFWSALDAVTVQWSKRMTVCAGLCKLQNGFCSINLSEPLLKLRPRKDLVETLLHEMIHAYLFVTNNKEHRNRDGHGPEFCKHMYRININAGTRISIYHNFHDEVNLYRQHWWKCNGPCQNNAPFFGCIKRCVNRAPGPYDHFWAHHQAICGGEFIKIKTPEGYGLKKKKALPLVPKKTVHPANKITNFIKILDSPKTTSESSNVDQKIEQDTVIIEDEDEMTTCPVCSESVNTNWLNNHLQNCSSLKEMFGDEDVVKCKCPACNDMIVRSLMNEHLDNCKMLINVFDDNDFVDTSDEHNNGPLTQDLELKYVNCPNCDKLVKDSNINEHLDICLLGETLNSSMENQIKCSSCKNTFKSIIELDSHIDICPLINL